MWCQFLKTDTVRTVRRCDGSPMRRFADATVRRCDGSPMRRFADATVRHAILKTSSFMPNAVSQNRRDQAEEPDLTPIPVKPGQSGCHLSNFTKLITPVPRYRRFVSFQYEFSKTGQGAAGMWVQSRMAAIFITIIAIACSFLLLSATY
jgi:hypothetical protein